MKKTLWASMVFAVAALCMSAVAIAAPPPSAASPGIQAAMDLSGKTLTASTSREAASVFTITASAKQTSPDVLTAAAAPVERIGGGSGDITQSQGQYALTAPGTGDDGFGLGRYRT